MVTYGLDKLGWSYWLRMGVKHANRGDYEDSIKCYKEAIEQDPDNVTIIFNNLADAYMNLGQLDEAMKYGREAVDRAPDQPISYVTLGEIHQAKGEHKEAVRYILRALNAYEEMTPQLRGALGDSIEEIVKKLPAELKLEIALKDWVRIIYFVKYLRATYQLERGIIEKSGASWKEFSSLREKPIAELVSKHLWAKERLGIKGDDAAAIANTFGAITTIAGSARVKVVEKSERRAVILIPTCWRYTVIKEMELDREKGWIECSEMCTKIINTLAKAINPNASFKFSATLPGGDKRCMGVLEIK
ncbi:MAG: tetratricopeptide repeat protein [Candidatus Bathyarchaeia archaeon]